MNTKSNRRSQRGNTSRRQAPQAAPAKRRVPTASLYAIPEEPRVGHEMVLYGVSAKGADIVMTPTRVIASKVRQTNEETGWDRFYDVFDVEAMTDHGQMVTLQIKGFEGQDDLFLSARPIFA